MAIKNLPNYVWVYPGKEDPLTGEIAQTRYALNLLDGKKLSLRQAQKLQHGGVSYEKRAPVGTRKQYKNSKPVTVKPVKVKSTKEKKKRQPTKYVPYIKKGPYKTLEALLEGIKNYKEDDIGHIMVRGYPSSNISPDLDDEGNIRKVRPVYRSITTNADVATIRNIAQRLIEGGRPTNPFEERIDRNLRGFTEIISYYFMKQR